MKPIEALRRLVLAAGCVAGACSAPSPFTPPCLVETPQMMPLSIRPLATRHVYRVDEVEIAMTDRTFDELREAICVRASFQEACQELVSISDNPPIEADQARVREQVIEYIVAGALDLGRATVRDPLTGELAPEIEIEAFSNTCGIRHHLGRRYSLPGWPPFFEVQDL